MFTVRRATKDDVEKLRSLRLEALRLHPHAFGADYTTELGRDASWWEERLRDPQRSAIFVVSSGDRIVGMAGMRKLQGEKLSHNGMMWGVYVDPASRGCGLASQLISACLDWAREAGLKFVKLAVVANNAAAIRCYERAGFRTYGIDPGVIRYDGLDYDELLMAREVPRELGTVRPELLAAKRQKAGSRKRR